MKKILAALLVTMLAANAFALQLRNHLIEATINEDGFATVTEKYVLRFDDINDVEAFNERAQRNSSSILAWKSDLPFFYPRFEKPVNTVSSSAVTFDPATSTLTMEYALEKPLMTLLKDEPREKKFGFTAKQLESFIQNGIIIIPDNTQISLQLPSKAQILGQDLSPQTEISGNKITLKPTTTSSISVEYIITKPIQTKVNSLELIREFISNSSNLAIIAVVLAVILGMLWKKDEIKEKIENYVVEHSEIEQGAVEEEIDLKV